MNIESIIQNITVFAQDNIIVTVVIGLFILYLLIRHPKVLLLITFLLVVAYGLAEFFDQLRGKAKL